MSAKYRFISFLLILAGLGIAYFDAVNFLKPESFLYSRILSIPFKLGLDLQGGVHLTYKADLSAIKPSETNDAMEGLRDVIERRVNVFGVGEPLVQVEKSASGDQRLIVELPGVANVNEAIKMIGETPFLEFRTESPNVEKLTEEEKRFFHGFRPVRFDGPVFEKSHS